ncbi:MAG: FHA domain-containing protein, partial [Chloroflexaceae bacterium]
VAEAPTVAAPTEEVPVAEAPTVAAPVEVPVAEAPTVAAPTEVPVAEAPTVAAPTEVPVAEAPTPPAGAPVFDRAAYEARRAELTDAISRQQQIIAQLEQMQATFGAATPAAVITGLAEAREALARAETELAALQAPAPAVDPAEVRRLQEEISRQQQIIAQLEQMQATFGAATPAAVITGLAEAREALARAEASLTALGPAPAPVTPAPVIEAPPPPPAPSGPRLVVAESGAVLPLPLDKTDIIIGREDPVSNIFPEIDLTPHGGELGGVSRQHARLSHSGSQWTVTDLNSTNYTRLNGARLEPNVPTPIADGARLQFGRIVVIVHLR